MEWKDYINQNRSKLSIFNVEKILYDFRLSWLNKNIYQKEDLNLFKKIDSILSKFMEYIYI
jgi:hypothetical protein